MAVGGGGGGGNSFGVRAGRAFVELAAKDVGLTKTLASLERRMGAVALAAKAMVAAVALYIGKQLVDAIKSGLDHFDKMKKAADRLGTTTDKISALGYAAEQSGASFEEMENASKFLQRNLIENADAFERIGLSADQLKKLSLDEQMVAVADAIAAMPDGAERTAAAMELLGKSGTKMLPLFMSGQLRALMQEAGDVGAIVDPTKAAQAERIGDAISRAWGSVVNTLRDLGSQFFGSVKDVELFSRAVVLTGKLVREHLIPAAKEWVSDVLPEMREGFAETLEGIKNAIEGGDIALAFKMAFKQVKLGFLEFRREIEVEMTAIANTIYSKMTFLVSAMMQAAARMVAPIDSDLARNLRGGAAALQGHSFAADVGDLNRQIDQIKKELQVQRNQARDLNATNPVLANAIALGQLALFSSMAAARRNAPGASMGSPESRGSFSTFAAEQALGAGGKFDKIEKNTGDTAKNTKAIDDKINNLRLEFQ